MYTRFYTKSPHERRQILEADGAQMLDILAGIPNEEHALFDRMSENVIGSWRLPLGVVPQMIVNGKCHRIAMATEEPSVVAAVNRTSKLLNACGGISCEVDSPVTMAQIAGIIPSECAHDMRLSLEHNKTRWIDIANSQDDKLVELGGGAFDLQIDILSGNDTQPLQNGVFCVLKLYVHTLDAMGANAVNTMAEAVLRAVAQEYPEFNSLMAILSNSGVGRMVHASCELPFEHLEHFVKMDGSDFAEKIAQASTFADHCPERAITHNKGIMNGIIAAALPLGQDTRAMNAAFYDDACKNGVHRPMVRWITRQNALIGEAHLPMPVGFVGGFRKIPAVNAAFAFDKIDNYKELCSLLTSVGIAQNLGALWALTTDGIQAGHMKLHERK